MARIGAVLLAAGASRRFGQSNKLLAEIDAIPLVRKVALVLAETRLAEIVAVTGCDRAAVEAALQDLPLTFRHNGNWARGMGGSIAAGIAGLSAECDGAFIVPGDLPLLTPGLLDTLITAFQAGGAKTIVFPVLSDGSQRNPVLWPRHRFPDLIALAGAEGGKTLLARFTAECRPLSIAGPESFIDIDTPEQLAALQAAPAP